MSLRTRLTISLVSLATLVFALSGLFTVWLAERSVIGAVDRAMSGRAQVILESPDSISSTAPVDARTSAPGATAQQPGTMVQLVRPDGFIVGSEHLPIDSSLNAELAEGQPMFHSIEIFDRPFRVLTQRSSAGVLQLATDVSTIQSGNADLRRGLAAFVVLGAGTAGAGGWLLARRLSKPLEEVTQATKQLTAGEDLPALIESSRSDEVGQLATTFNGLVSSLRSSREQQTRLVADASHELRTPLTTLRVKIDFLESDPELDADLRTKVLTGASADLAALSDLVAELVDLAANDLAQEDPKTIDLTKLLEGVATHFRLTNERDVTVRTSGTIVEGRPRMLTRAVTNLINNAHKYSPPEETIHVYEEQGHIEVRDRGPGIREEDLPFVFDRFFRSPLAKPGVGSGIGLAIVKQAAEAHNGEVWAHSRPGGGTSVGFSIDPSRISTKSILPR